MVVNISLLSKFYRIHIYNDKFDFMEIQIMFYCDLFIGGLFCDNFLDCARILVVFFLCLFCLVFPHTVMFCRNFDLITEVSLG